MSRVSTWWRRRAEVVSGGPESLRKCCKNHRPGDFYSKRLKTREKALTRRIAIRNIRFVPKGNTMRSGSSVG